MSKPKSKDKIGNSIDVILGGLTIRGREEKKRECSEEEFNKLKAQLAAYQELGTLEMLRQEKEELVQRFSQWRQDEEIWVNTIKKRKKEADLLLQEADSLHQQKETYIQELDQMKKDIHQLSDLIHSLEGNQDKLVRSIEVLKLEREKLEREIQYLQKEKNALIIPESEELSIQEKDKQAYQPSLIIRQYCERSEGKRKLTIHLREVDYQAIHKVSHHFHSNKGRFMEIITRALRFYISKSYYQDSEREVYQKAIYAVRDLLEEMGFSTEAIEKRITQGTTLRQQ